MAGASAPIGGTVGDACVNAMAENFLANLDCELIDRKTIRTKTEARQQTSPRSKAGTTRAGDIRRSAISPMNCERKNRVTEPSHKNRVTHRTAHSWPR